MVSQQLETLLAVEDAVAGTYDLEVSSPGIDRLLFTKNQYGRYLDSKLDLRLHMPIDGSRHLRGILQSVAADSFALLVGNELKAIPFVQVRRARLVPNFE